TLLWTSLDSVNTLCWVTTPALIFATPSPGFKSLANGVTIDYDNQPTLIVNATPNSFALWGGQTYSNKGVQLGVSALSGGVQTITSSTQYTSGIPVYNDLITYSQPMAPLGTLSVDVYIAAGSPTTTIGTLAPPALGAQNAPPPVTIPLANREAVCTWFMSEASYRNANNPRGYFSPTLN